ncbi:MAG: hypothetical protein ACLTGX_11630 [Clostridium sp.]
MEHLISAIYDLKIVMPYLSSRRNRKRDLLYAFVMKRMKMMSI